MVVGLSGWMDGGEVSTGTVDCLARKLHAREIGRIAPADFYIYSFPGSMEISALFRPACRVEDGIVRDYEPPTNILYCDESTGVVLFLGKEPHLRWDDYADCLFTAARELHVQRMYFVGSVAGAVPHTRDPRLFSAISDESLRQEMLRHGVRFSGYEGPASISTCLTKTAADHGLEVATLVAEIPAYIQGRNPRCIEAVVRRLAGMLEADIRLDDLRAQSDQFEDRLNKIIRSRTELAQLIDKLESDYDSEVFDTQMDDLKLFLHQQGIRLD